MYLFDACISPGVAVHRPRCNQALAFALKQAGENNERLFTLASA